MIDVSTPADREDESPHKTKSHATKFRLEEEGQIPYASPTYSSAHFITSTRRPFRCSGQTRQTLKISLELLLDITKPISCSHPTHRGGSARVPVHTPSTASTQGAFFCFCFSHTRASCMRLAAKKETKKTTPNTRGYISGCKK